MTRLEAISTSSPVDLAETIITSRLTEAVAARGRFLMVLAGGRTPEPLYRRLAARSDIPWDRVHLFWGDERFVPADHPDNNARAARAALVERVPVPAEQVHPWPILATPAASAAAYAATVSRFAGDPPDFDLNILGLGSDCHSASIFPGSGALEQTGLAFASRPAALSGYRLSLTAAALSSSRTTLFLVTGADKRAAIARLLEPGGSSDDCPARAIGASERLLLLTDQPLPAG